MTRRRPLRGARPARRRASRRWTLAGLAGALAAGLAGAACGPEDIQLAHDDASVREAGVDGGGGTLPEDDGSPPTCEASAPPPACLALGGSCTVDHDCCSAHCASDLCVRPGTCAGFGVACSVAADCCSGRCEPTTGTLALACLAECSPDAVGCVRASDCCALDCNNGVCGGAECLQEGTDCVTSAQCCSNLCDATQGNKCMIDPVAACRPSGESCNSGGKGSCCSRVCDDALQRCDPGPSGPGACRPRGATCSQATSDCCNGAPCAPNASGDQVCTGQLLVNGASCQASFECMSGSCTNNPPSCGARLTACIPTGAACGDGGACCSGICTGGLCQSGCIPATR